MATASSSAEGSESTASSPPTWKKVYRQTKAVRELQKVQLTSEARGILALLERSPSLGGQLSSGTHSQYLGTLRRGFKKRIAQHHRFVAATAANAISDENTGKAITMVTSKKEIEELEYWKQGDASLATAEKLVEREALRFDRRVMNELNAFWEVVMNSYCRCGDEAVDPFMESLPQEAHAMMMKRIYRIMLRAYDEDDAKITIADDWKSDAKGKASITRKEFGDALFELADTWTSGICASEYAIFLRNLCRQISTEMQALSGAFWPDGSPVMETVLKDEADCHFDAETYGDDEDGRYGRGHGASGHGEGEAGTLGQMQHWALRKGDFRRKQGEDEGGEMLGLAAFGSNGPTFGHAGYRQLAISCVKNANEPPSSARRIQSQFRRMDSQQKFPLRKAAVVNIQSETRVKLARNEVRARKVAIVDIQRFARRKIARNKVGARKVAIANIQYAARRRQDAVLARKARMDAEYDAQRKMAAIRIQSRVRGRTAARSASRLRNRQEEVRLRKAAMDAELKEVCIIKIQTRARGKIAERAVSRIRSRHYENELRRALIAQEDKATAVSIKSGIRSKLARAEELAKAVQEERLQQRRTGRRAAPMVQRPSAASSNCYWCHVQVEDYSSTALRRLASESPVLPAETQHPLAPALSTPNLRRTGSKPSLVRPYSAGLLRSVVYVPPPSPPARPSSAAPRVIKSDIPRVPSADVLRNHRGKAPLPRAATAAVFRKAGVLTPDSFNGPDRYMWYRSSGAMVQPQFRRRPYGGASFGDHLRMLGPGLPEQGSRRWDPIVGRLV